MKPLASKIIGMAALSFFTAAGHSIGQNVIKVSRPYVLIDTDRKIGRIGERVVVKRTEIDQTVDVGVVELMRIKSGKTIARIIDENEGYSVDIGDRISSVKASGTENRDSRAKPFDIDDLADLEKPEPPPSITADRNRTPVLQSLDPFVILDGNDRPRK